MHKGAKGLNVVQIKRLKVEDSLPLARPLANKKSSICNRASLTNRRFVKALLPRKYDLQMQVQGFDQAFSLTFSLNFVLSLNSSLFEEKAIQNKVRPSATLFCLGESLICLELRSVKTGSQFLNRVQVGRPLVQPEPEQSSPEQSSPEGRTLMC